MGVMGFGSKKEKFKSQDFKELRSFHLQQGSVFVDPAFPSVDAVLGTSALPPDIAWKRPKELDAKAKLFACGENITTIRAGPLSCNWFVSACAVLAGLNEIKNKVIPDYWQDASPAKGDSEETPTTKYCGLYRFRFWRFGVWQEVVIDDLLPTVNNELLGTSSTDSKEFWPALLEKAYAKLHGGYDAMGESELCDALVDFTGGISETIDLQADQLAFNEDKRHQFLELIVKEMSDHSIICFNMAAPAESDIGSRTELGLIRGHTYLLTDLKKVYLGESSLRTLFKGREKVYMLRLRNLREESTETPSSPASNNGNGEKENGQYAYSTSALSRLKSRLSEWQKVRDSERQRLGLLTRGDNEFWMPLEDVVGEYSEAVIVRLVSENPFAVGRRWRGTSSHGHWRTGTAASSAGGGSPDSASFLQNPQYTMDVHSDSEVIIQLMQYHTILTTQTPSERMHFLIGFHVIKVEENRECRSHRLWSHQEIVVSTGHKRRREVTYRGHLPVGRYLLVPSTYKPGDTAMFLLRVISASNLQIKELKEEMPRSSIFMCSCLSPSVEWITVITIKNAESLGAGDNNPWQVTSPHPYCEIDCEGTKVKTDIAKIDAQPIWNKSYVFYRKHTNKPLHIRVYSHNKFLRDTLVGECSVPGGVTHGRSDLSLTLRPKQSNSNATPPNTPPTAGVLHVTLLTEDNLQAI